MSPYFKLDPLIKFIGEIPFYAFVFPSYSVGGFVIFASYVLHYYDCGGIQCMLWRADPCQDDPS